jgi:hypothetical protein
MFDPALMPLGATPFRQPNPSVAPMGHAWNSPAWQSLPTEVGARLLNNALFSNGEQGGYWPADPAYMREDSAGTTAVSVGGVQGLWFDALRSSIVLRRNILNKLESISFAGGFSVKSIVSMSNPTGLTNVALFTGADLMYGGIIRAPYFTFTGSVYSLSAYIKKGNWRYIGIRMGNLSASGVKYAFFDFDTETVNLNGISCTVVATDVGDGWYRLSMTGSPNAGYSVIDLAMIDSDGASDTNGNGRTVYTAGFQLEVGALTDYQAVTNYSDIMPGNHAVQATTGNKPIVRRTPQTGKYWLDGNTSTAAMTVTFPSSLGSACTIARVTPEGVTFTEGQTITSTYNLTPPYGYNSDVLIINRALTPAEKALVTKVLSRNVPMLGNELVVNGDFSGGTAGWLNRPGFPYGAFTVTDGVARVTGNAVDSLGGIFQLCASGNVSGRQFCVKGSARNVSSSLATFRISASDGSNKSPVFQAASTTMTEYIGATQSSEVSSGFGITFYPGAISTIAEYDNASVKEIL